MLVRIYYHLSRCPLLHLTSYFSLSTYHFSQPGLTSLFQRFTYQLLEWVLISYSLLWLLTSYLSPPTIAIIFVAFHSPLSSCNESALPTSHFTLLVLTSLSSLATFQDFPFRTFHFLTSLSFLFPLLTFHFSLPVYDYDFSFPTSWLDLHFLLRTSHFPPGLNVYHASRAKAPNDWDIFNKITVCHFNMSFLFSFFF